MAKNSTKSRLSNSASAFKKLLSPSAIKDLTELSQPKSLAAQNDSTTDTSGDGRRSSAKSDRRRSSGIRISFVERRRSSCKSTASSSLNAAPVVKVSILMKLITSAQWDALRKYLASEEGICNVAKEMMSVGGYDSELGIQECDGSMTMHLVARAHPPLDIVAKLMRFNPALTAQVDALGRTPLHVAAAYGASPQVVRFLLQQDVSAAAKLDFEGKTPLHLCCEKCCGEGACDPGLGNGQLVKGPMSEVLKMLAKAFPDSLNREDEMEMSPLEHAIVNGADVKVVKLLQKLSVIEWRKVANEEPDFFGAHLNFDTTPMNCTNTTSENRTEKTIAPPKEPEMSETSSISDDASLHSSPMAKPLKTTAKIKTLPVSRKTRPSDNGMHWGHNSANSCPAFCEASLLKAVLKAGSDSASDIDARSVTSICNKLGATMGSGRVTAQRGSRPLRRRSSCNAAA